jgi:hypothetical protein
MLSFLVCLTRNKKLLGKKDAFVNSLSCDESKFWKNESVVEGVCFQNEQNKRVDVLVLNDEL